MKVVLVDNLLFEGGLATPRFNLQPHLGLMSLAAVLRETGIDTAIVDPKLEVASGRLRLDNSLASAFGRRLAAEDADVVGFTALGCNFPFVVRAATWLRRLRPGTPILLGGPHATILHRQILESLDCFDVVVRHEAEQILPLVIEALAGKRSLLTIPSISFRTKRGTLVDNGSIGIVEDLDGLPMPAYDTYPIGDMGLDEIRIEAGRGCPFSCTFCSTATFFGRQYRLKSPERLRHEMVHLNATYGFTAFKLNHDLFTVNRHKVQAFCEAIADCGFSWSCSARVDCVDEALLTSMRAAGCRHIYFGIETGSERMQDISRKKLDLALVEPTLRITEALGIATTTSFIAGYPQETRADQDQTLDAVGRLHVRPRGLNEAQLHLLAPEPGTALIEEFRHALRVDDHVSEFSLPTLDDEDTGLVQSSPALFSNHFYFEGLLPRARNVRVTSLWIVLHGLGVPLMHALLDRFDSRLSILADQVDAWAAANGDADPAMDPPKLLAFVAERFGATSALASVLRFHVARWRLQRLPQPEAKPAAAPAAGGAALALSDYAVLLEDIHDMSPLLHSPDSAPLVLRAPLDARGDALMTRDPQGLHYFALDRPTAMWLGRLRSPNAADGPWPDADDVAQLVRMGVLTAAPADVLPA